MEYFNSFGGNPVSLAAGNAVLEVIEKEKLQNNALLVGNYLKDNLCKLKIKYPSKIIDIRGEGLFLGIDLVKDSNPNLPDSDLAKFIINNSKELGVILGIDGPNNNVIKIKPPLIFNKENSNFLCDCIEKSILLYNK